MCHHHQLQYHSYDGFMFIDEDGDDDGDDVKQITGSVAKLSPQRMINIASSNNSGCGNNNNSTMTSNSSSSASPIRHNIHEHYVRHQHFSQILVSAESPAEQEQLVVVSSMERGRCSSSEQPGDGTGYAMSEEEVKILRESFNLVKNDAIDIGALGVNHIFKKIPEARQKFCRNIGPSDGSRNNWELMEQGLTFLSGIERCLLRLSRNDSFEAYVESLTTAHTTSYGVQAELVIQSLREFELVLLTFLQHVQLKHDLDVVLNTWQKFFNLLRTTIAAADKKQEQQQSSIQEA